MRFGGHVLRGLAQGGVDLGELFLVGLVDGILGCHTGDVGEQLGAALAERLLEGDEALVGLCEIVRLGGEVGVAQSGVVMEGGELRFGGLALLARCDQIFIQLREAGVVGIDGGGVDAAEAEVLEQGGLIGEARGEVALQVVAFVLQALEACVVAEELLVVHGFDVGAGDGVDDLGQMRRRAAMQADGDLIGLGYALDLQRCGEALCGGLLALFAFAPEAGRHPADGVDHDVDAGDAVHLLIDVGVVVRGVVGLRIRIERFGIGRRDVDDGLTKIAGAITHMQVEEADAGGDEKDDEREHGVALQALKEMNIQGWIGFGFLTAKDWKGRCAGF